MVKVGIEMTVEKSKLEIKIDEIRRKYLGPLMDNCMHSYMHEEENRHRTDGLFQRDYTRIMYASSFRRLQGKMQLLGIKNDQFFRNRLTHSLEVAQIARSIAYRSLLSIVKYFKKFDKEAHLEGHKQKFIYDSDYKILEQFINDNHVKVRTLDVQIVDIADEIAYAAHDLEDGLRIKAFTMDEILHDYQSRYGETECFIELVKIVENAKNKAGYGNGKIASSEYSKLFRQEVSSALIHLFLNDIDLLTVEEKYKIKTGTSQEQSL